MAKGKNRTKAVTGVGPADAKVEEEVSANALVEAKAKLDAARKRKTSVNKDISKHKRTLKDGQVRVEKLKEQIARAKVRTTNSAEELLKKAAEIEKELVQLTREEKTLEKQASPLYRAQEDLRIELGEVRAANKKSSSSSDSTGGAGWKVNSQRSTLVKALARRQFVVQYGTGDSPVAIGAKSQDNKLVIVLGNADFTVAVDGAKATTHNYGAGAALSIDRAFQSIPKEDAAASTGTDGK